MTYHLKQCEMNNRCVNYFNVLFFIFLISAISISTSRKYKNERDTSVNKSHLDSERKRVHTPSKNITHHFNQTLKKVKRRPTGWHKKVRKSKGKELVPDKAMLSDHHTMLAGGMLAKVLGLIALKKKCNCSDDSTIGTTICKFGKAIYC